MSSSASSVNSSSRVVRSASLAAPTATVRANAFKMTAAAANCGTFSRVTVHHHHTLGRASGVAAAVAAAAAAEKNSSPSTSSSPTAFSLTFAPDDLASQLSLLDLAVFRGIQPDELASCSWNKKNKLEAAPNVVAFIRRFNHVSFWTVQEILRHEQPRRRAEALAHFIKLAKRLHELNNLHCEFAVLSALQSAAIYRLSRTWALLSKKDRQTFERLADLFSERDNFARLREHMGGTALKHEDCIPYLGLYLTDLIYVDMAHPHSGGLESQQRQFKMNNILRIVSELQRSTYANLVVIEECQMYLRSIRYIDELQKFIEDDNYKLSLKLEPNSTSAPSSTSSKESVISSSAKNFSGRDPGLMAELNLSPVKGRTGQSRSTGKATQKPFVPGHRKCKSDGHNIFLSCSGGGSSSRSGAGADDLSSWASGTLSSGTPSEECFRQHNLIDDSLVEDPCSSCQGAASDSGSARSGSIDLRRSRTLGKEGSKQQLLSPLSDSVKLPGLSATSPVGTSCSFQGCVKRKTLIKDGRRPTMSGWQRYWLQLWGRQLVFFLPRTLVTKGIERRDFKTEPCKCQSVEGWVVMVPDSGLGATDELSFQLADPSRRSVYRFRAPSPELAKAWVRCLHGAAVGVQQEQSQQPPANLISFE